MMKSESRRCAKCGISTSEFPNIKMYRFPKVSWNITRNNAWAKFAYPDGEWSSREFQQKLYIGHKMLCENHFAKSSFTDYSLRKLGRYAIPVSNILQVDIAGSENVDISEDVDGDTMIDDDTNQQLDSLNVEPNSTNEYSIAYNMCRKYLRRICKLKKEFRKKTRNYIINNIASNKTVEKLSKTLTRRLAVSLQNQLFNCRLNTREKKWSSQQKIRSLQLYKRSPTCYRLLRRLFALPCQGTLNKLLKRLPFHSAVNSQVFSVLKRTVSKKFGESNECECVLLFDEMTFKDQDLESPGHLRQAVVFMVVGIWKRYKQPVCYYLTDYLTTYKLTVIIKEVLNSCFLAGFHIAATVSDTNCLNRSALGMLGVRLNQPYFQHNGHEIVALYDPPHLLRCFRNLFTKYDVRYEMVNSGQTTKGIAQWKHITEFYKEDSRNQLFVFAPCLTEDHLKPTHRRRLKVHFATGVFSHTVAVGLFAKVSQGVLPANAFATATLVHKIDWLFKSLDADSADKDQDFKLSLNLTNRSPHLEYFTEMTPIIGTLEFIGSKRRVCQDSILQTMRGVDILWKNLRNKYPEQRRTGLATGRLKLDPLNNFFNSIRSYNGGALKPTRGEFVDGFKTAVICGLQYTKWKATCNDDRNEALNNLHHFLRCSDKGITKKMGKKLVRHRLG